MARCQKQMEDGTNGKKVTDPRVYFVVRKTIDMLTVISKLMVCHLETHQRSIVYHAKGKNRSHDNHPT